MQDLRLIHGATLALTVSLLTAVATANASCGASFCAVNTQWETQGAWTGSGLRLDLRYEYTDQNQLRSGADKVEAGGVPGTIDETRTLSRNLFLGVDYAFDPAWAVALQLPVLQRQHSHVDNGPPATIESWDITGPGDLRLLGRRQFALDAASSGGILFGLKLPTGRFDDTNSSGVPAERALQAGSGTTDGILGGYYYRQLEGDATTLFAQLLWQQPLNERDSYEPGRQLLADVGLRYALTLATSAMLQLNLLDKAHDQGINAEPGDSGGRFAYLSPGVSHAFTPHLQAYGFVQLPLYQYVNGTQLTADWSALAGLSWRQ